MEVETAIWALRLPLRINLSSADLGTCRKAEALYVSHSAVSYLPLLLPRVEKHFEPEDIKDVWFSYQGSPIREIDVHFGQFPEDALERLTVTDVESAFQMSVKEADQIRTKSQLTAQFQQTDWKRMWSGLVQNQRDQWSGVAGKLKTETPEEAPVPAKFHYDQVYYQAPFTKEETLEAALARFELTGVKLLTCGVELDQTTTIGELTSVAFPDTFIHLVIQHL